MEVEPLTLALGSQAWGVSVVRDCAWNAGTKDSLYTEKASEVLRFPSSEG